MEPPAAAAPKAPSKDELSAFIALHPAFWPTDPSAPPPPIEYRLLPKHDAVSPPATSVEERARASLIGLAWGDALGCPVEGYRTAAMAAIYGGAYTGLPRLLPVHVIKKQLGGRALKRLRPIGLHSDDTQQALALLSVCMDLPAPVSMAVLRKAWGECLVAGGVCGAWRGTGRHFNVALHRLIKRYDPTVAGDASAGMGASMRIGPLGALFRSQPDDVLREVVYNVSLVTHRTVEAPTGAYAVAWAVKRFVLGASAAEVRAGLEAQAAQAEQAFFRSQQTAKPDWSEVANGGSVAPVYGKVLRRAEELRTQKVGRQELWKGIRVAVSEAARIYVENGGGSIDSGRGEGAAGEHDEDLDVETPQTDSAAEFEKGNDDGLIKEADVSVKTGEEKSEKQKVASEVKGEGAHKAAAKGKAKAKAKKKAGNPKPRLHAFSPNQGHVTLGAMHALMLCILDNTEIGNPNEILLSIIECGYDTDTVCAIAGSILGARFGLSWIPVTDLLDRTALERWAAALATQGPAPETLDSLLRRESLLSGLERHTKEELLRLYG